MSDDDTDLVMWRERRAALLRRMGAGARVNHQVAWGNVAEEIESLGRSDRRALPRVDPTTLVLAPARVLGRWLPD